jgi:hypothetical protein
MVAEIDLVTDGKFRVKDSEQTTFVDLDSLVKGEGITTKLDDLGAPDDNTDLNASTSAHGLCPKGSNDSEEFLRGDMTWNTPVRVVVIKVIADDTALATGDGKCYFTVPVELNGWNLVTVGAHVYTVSSSGTPIVQLHNLTDTADMLSTRITIDANEKDSKDATAAAVIDTTHDDVATGDEIRIDVDGAGTGTKGLEVRMGFRKP